MGFIKSLKGKMSHKDEQEQYQNQYSDPPSDHKQLDSHQNQSPEIAYDDHTTKTEKQRLFELSNNNLSSSSQYPESSPSYSSLNSYAPPPGPPPSTATNPPPYESWLSIPDNSLLPPPPSITNEHSSANNASFYSAEQGHRWCASHPIYTPSIPQATSIIESSQQGHLGLDQPPSGFKGTIRKLDNLTWEIKTDKRQQDMTLISTLPIYFAAVSNPLLQVRTATVSIPVTFCFTTTILKIHPSAGIALGFTAKPYPPFRLPGWHRGSLAIHSDDGNRYMNDPYGGIDFTQPFKANDQLRISMTIFPRLSPVQEYHGKMPGVMRVGGGLPKCVSRVEVERNGVGIGGWDVCEERDGEKDEGVEGLQGEADLYVGLGVFGMGEFVVRFATQ